MRLTLPVAALFLAACADPSPPAPRALLPISPPIDSSPAPPPPVVEAAAVPPAPDPSLEPPTVALPEPAACVLDTSWWRGARETSDLRFREGGPIFARVSMGKARLHLPVGSVKEGAGLEIADEIYALRGHLASDEIWLHAGKAVVLGGAVIPLGSAKLEWTSARPGAVAVTFDPHEGIELVQPPLAGDVPCEALALDDTTIEPSAALPALKRGKPALLRAGASIAIPIPLSLTAGGAPLANLTPKAGADAIVTVMESAGKSTRVAWERATSLIFGWVPTAQLEFPRKLPVAHGYGTGTGSGGGGGHLPSLRVVCPEDVPFVVEAAGERMTVGKILAGVTINLADSTGDYRRFVIRDRGLQLIGDKTLVRAQRLKDCPLVHP
jgi:hypothetical protein